MYRENTLLEQSKQSETVKLSTEIDSPTSVNSWIQQLTNMEALNFLLTNRIPRNFSTKMMGRFSRIKNPLVAKASIGLWKTFVDDLKLDEAEATHFDSMHECFIRTLKPGARPIDAREDIVTSPCDAVVGAHGNIKDTQLYQIKGFPYSLEDLLGDSIDIDKYRNGRYITLRIKSSMYHRFHAPLDCNVKQVHYISGDTWNVNPITLKRVEKLFCKNERAIIDLDVPKGWGSMALVPVAAILVASMKFDCLEETLDLNYQGKNTLDCDASYEKGQHMGYFQHGSTIVLLCDENYDFASSVKEGEIIRVGQALMHANVGN